MFGLGIGELLIILVIVLVIFGAGRLPQLGEGLGRSLRSFKREVTRPDELEAPRDGQAKPDSDDDPTPPRRG
jgi:sec-independent protein translocase protein TatA